MDAKEDIRRRLSIEDVVGSYIELKRAGRSFKALSPFKTEKTPSFVVSPDKQIWHDFSANKGGDIFSFVMEMEGVEFVEAMEILARKAGVDLTQYQRGSGQTAKLKKRMADGLELSAKYYHASLAKNKPALSYLRRDRGYENETIKKFQLGYAPTEGTALYKFLVKRKFTPQELSKSGLIVSWRGQPRDMFRGRITVPLHDGSGRVVGFTARLLRDEPGVPKYINTPQTLLYDKGRHVYGLHLAKSAIREQDKVVLVEGNMDVVASHQAGVANCVATAGTALTTDHLRQISRLTTNVVLAFDQDSAGIQAAIRAIPLAYELGIHLAVADLQGGKDPDEIIKKDVKLWTKAVESPQYVMDWLAEYFAKQHDLDKATGKRSYSDQMVIALARLKDPVEREHYVGVVSDKTGVSKGRIEEKIRDYIAKSKTKTLKAPRKTHDNESKIPTYTYVDTFLGMLVLYDNTRQALTKLKDVEMDTERQQQLLDELLDNPEISKEALQSDSEYVNIVTFRAEEFYGEFSSSARLADAMKTARRIAEEMKKKRRGKLAEAMRSAKDSADEKTHNLLLKEVQSTLKED